MKIIIKDQCKENLQFSCSNSISIQWRFVFFELPQRIGLKQNKIKDGALSPKWDLNIVITENSIFSSFLFHCYIFVLLISWVWSIFCPFVLKFSFKFQLSDCNQMSFSNHEMRHICLMQQNWNSNISWFLVHCFENSRNYAWLESRVIFQNNDKSENIGYNSLLER